MYILWFSERRMFICLFAYCSVCHLCFHFILLDPSGFFSTWLASLHQCPWQYSDNSDAIHRLLLTSCECRDKVPCCNFTQLYGQFYVKSLFLGPSLSSPCEDSDSSSSGVCDAKQVQKSITLMVSSL